MLQSSANETGICLLKEGSGHSHRITIESTRLSDDAVQVRAVLLVRSSQWYQHRLNVFGQVEGIELVVCGKHDSCVPVQVWSVEEAKMYEPGETVTDLAQLRDVKVRGTKYGSLLFVAAILAAKQEALDILEDEDFPQSTRYRYEAKVRYYANLRPGVKLSLT
jgi:hypothetical protein